MLNEIGDETGGLVHPEEVLKESWNESVILIPLETAGTFLTRTIMSTSIVSETVSVLLTVPKDTVRFDVGKSACALVRAFVLENVSLVGAEEVMLVTP
jgi:hypothetical protein